MLATSGLFFAAAAVAAGCAGPKRMTLGELQVVTFDRGSTNAHLLVRGKDLAMVDSGYEENGPALEKDLRDAGYDPANLRAIILTHGHADHAGGARYFQQKFHTKVIAGAGDQKMMAVGRNDAQPMCPTGFLGRMRRSTDSTATYTSTAADIWLDPAGSLQLKDTTGIDGTIVSLPGHTVGSLVVATADAVFVGDLFRGSLIGSGAATHLYMCDVEGNRRDIDKVLHQIGPKVAWFFPGHFGPVSREAVADAFDLTP